VGLTASTPLGAALSFGIPLYWMTVVRRRPIAELGLTSKRWGLGLVLQLACAALLYFGTIDVFTPQRVFRKRPALGVTS
jgi:hypothetical protein